MSGLPVQGQRSCCCTGPPASSRLYIPALEKLGSSGYAGYAPDNMGYGQSDPRPRALVG